MFPLFAIILDQPIALTTTAHYKPATGLVEPILDDSLWTPLVAAINACRQTLTEIGVTGIRLVHAGARSSSDPIGTTHSLISKITLGAPDEGNATTLQPIMQAAETVLSELGDTHYALQNEVDEPWEIDDLGPFQASLLLIRNLQGSFSQQQVLGGLSIIELDFLSATLLANVYQTTSRNDIKPLCSTRVRYGSGISS